MNRILIAISSILIISTANADYTIKIPMEQALNGPLPNGSITFNAGSTQTPATPTKDCRYEFPQNFWGAGKDTNTDEFFAYWDNDNVSHIPNSPTHTKGYDTRSFVHNGATYTRGEEMERHGNYIHYVICQEK